MLDALQQKGQFLTMSRQDADSLVLNQSFSVANNTQATVLAPGIIVFEPQKPTDTPTKHIVYSCGVHGNETAPIEICDKIVQDIILGNLVIKHRVLFIFGNLASMDIAERFVEENMNRLFCGAHSKGPGLINSERRRAKQLEDAVAQFFAPAGSSDTKIHYDLHTAIRASKNEKFAVYPFLHGGLHSLSQLGFIASCGVKTILLSESVTTTFSYHSSVNHNAHAFTVELGKVKPFGQNDMSRFADAEHSLRALISEDDYSPSVALSELDIYRVNQVINKHKDDFVLHFSDDEPNFSDFAKGTVLASETGSSYIAEQDGEAIVFPNANVALGQRALLTVVPTTLEKLDV